MARNGLQLDSRKLVQALATVRRTVDDAQQEALDVAAEIITSEAKQEGVVPYLTGALADSHTWAKGDRPSERIIGANTSYAAAVHARHPTKARWLLRTVLEKGPGVINRALKAAMAKRRIT